MSDERGIHVDSGGGSLGSYPPHHAPTAAAAGALRTRWADGSTLSSFAAPGSGARAVGAAALITSRLRLTPELLLGSPKGAGFLARPWIGAKTVVSYTKDECRLLGDAFRGRNTPASVDTVDLSSALLGCELPLANEFAILLSRTGPAKHEYFVWDAGDKRLRGRQFSCAGRHDPVGDGRADSICAV